MDVDALNALVSSAIWRAEQLEDLGLESASAAWMEVCKLEEELAKVIPANEAEGRIARRGAVRAAVKANDLAVAQHLVETFSSEEGASKEFLAKLRQLLKVDAAEFGRVSH